MALQFQDITQQKLQRLKHPMLTELTTSLQAIFDETRSLSGKLQGTGMVDSGKSSATPFRVSRSGDHAERREEEVETPASTEVTEPGRPKPQGDNAVEIF